MHSERTFFVALIALIIAIAFTAIGGATQVDPANRDQMRVAAMEAFGLERARLVDIQGIADVPAALEVELAIDGQSPLLLDLDKWSMRSIDFALKIQDASGELVEIDAPAPRTYRGTIVGRTRAEVSAAVRPNGQFEATLHIGDKIFSVEPVSDVLPGASSTLHILYRTTDVVLKEQYSCGVFEGNGENGFHNDGEQAGYSGDDIYECEIAFDADREFFQLNGSSTGNTIADIEAVMARVITIYERDTSITYTTTQTIVRTSEPDPYSSTDPGTLLGQFQSEWNGNQQGVHRDVAHLMTGKNINGGVIGIAALGTICNLNSAYGLSQSRFTSGMSSRAALTAHELGHNWASGHCGGSDCRIMCPGLGGCTGDISKFGAASIGTITAFRNSRTCIDIAEDPVAIPFVDTFDGGTLDPEMWSEFSGISLVEFAGNEITPPASMNLDAQNDTDFDQITSLPMLLAGESNVFLSYFVKIRNVEAGESLDVEYFGSNDQWNLIETIVSDGSTDEYFKLHHSTLTGNALHDEFRLRMTANVNFPLDDFFIDNLSICAGDIAISATPDAISVPVGGTFTFDASVTNLTGSTRASSAWIDVTAPDGSAVFGSGNPRFGPKAFSLNGGQVKARNNLPITIPGSASAGTGYKVIAYVGDITTGEVCGISEFEFEVTP